MKNSASYLFKSLLYLYALVLLRLIVFKGSAAFLSAHLEHYSAATIREGYRLANFIPGKTLYYYLSLREDFHTGLQNIGGNIVLFIPCGFLLPLAYPQLRLRRRLLLILFLTSLFFESLQLAFAIGTFDVDDLLLNVLGGWIGYGFLRLFIARPRWDRTYPAPLHSGGAGTPTTAHGDE